MQKKVFLAKYTIFIFVILLCMVFSGLTDLMAAEEEKIKVVEGKKPVAIKADRLDYMEKEDLIVATGFVDIKHGEMQLTADRVEINLGTGDSVAIGNVVFMDGKDRITGERMEYNFNSETGIVFEGKGYTAPYYFVSGRRMEKTGDRTYRVLSGTFTTCEGDSPAWSTRSSTLNVVLDDYLTAHSASFWVKGIPLFYFPYFRTSLSKERKSGFLMPQIGQSTSKGYSITNQFYLVFGDSHDATFLVDYFSRKGFGGGLEYRYVLKDGVDGQFRGYYIKEKDTDEKRWAWNFIHNHRFTDDLIGKADMHSVSDINFFRDYGDSLDERSQQRIESNVFLTQNWRQWSLLFLIKYYQDLTADVKNEIQRLPEVRLTGLKQPLFNTPLLFDIESSAVNFRREEGIEAVRLDVHPRLSLPISPGGYFALTPTVGVRETAYSKSQTKNEWVRREMYEIETNLETRIQRVYQINLWSGINAIQHVLEPRVYYRFVPERTQSDLPQFDGIDNIPKENRYVYSLVNRINARSGSGNDVRKWEFARLTLTQYYDMNLSEKRFSDIYGDMALTPIEPLRLRMDAVYSTYQHNISSFNSDISFSKERWGLTFGSRYDWISDIKFLSGSVEARLNPQWNIYVTSRYDVKAKEIIENRYEVGYRKQCWGVDFLYIKRIDEDEFRVTLNFLELGSIPFGRVLGGSKF